MAHLLIRTLALVLASAGCGPTTPGPPQAPHTGDTPVAIPYLPPTPRAEELGQRPSETAVWVDGSWRFTGAGFAWSPGAWVEPRPGWAYAPPEVVRLRTGELLYYEGVWKPPSTNPDDDTDTPPPEAPAEPPKGEGT